LDDYKRIAEAFALLATVAFPPNFLSDMELAFVNSNAQVRKQQRAAEKLALIGYREAAQSEGCCVATIYNRTHAHRNSKKMAIG
jgi:hypothetical protein